jgi:ribulose-5-phosphate 4-epimerase/fuculose-1-phosphate aldolase
MDESLARKLICEVGNLLYDRSYVVASDGNVSIRLDENTVLATPTMTCKGRMTEDSLALTDMEGRPLTDKRASSELAMHLLIYKMRPDVKGRMPCASAAWDRICCCGACDRQTHPFRSYPDAGLCAVDRLRNAVNRRTN